MWSTWDISPSIFDVRVQSFHLWYTLKAENFQTHLPTYILSLCSFSNYLLIVPHLISLSNFWMDWINNCAKILIPQLIQQAKITVTWCQNPWTEGKSRNSLKACSFKYWMMTHRVQHWTALLWRHQFKNSFTEIFHCS